MMLMKSSLLSLDPIDKQLPHSQFFQIWFILPTQAGLAFIYPKASCCLAQALLFENPRTLHPWCRSQVDNLFRRKRSLMHPCHTRQSGLLKFLGALSTQYVFELHTEYGFHCLNSRNVGMSFPLAYPQHPTQSLAGTGENMSLEKIVLITNA